MKKISCIISNPNFKNLDIVLNHLRGNGLIDKILLGSKRHSKQEKILFFPYQKTKSTEYLKEAINLIGQADYILWIDSNQPISFGQFAIERMLEVAENTDAGMVYSNFILEKEGQTSLHPVIDYQAGSLRDDFNFGPITLWDANSFKGARCPHRIGSNCFTNYLMTLKPHNCPIDFGGE